MVLPPVRAFVLTQGTVRSPRSAYHRFRVVRAQFIKFKEDEVRAQDSFPDFVMALFLQPPDGAMQAVSVGAQILLETAAEILGGILTAGVDNRFIPFTPDSRPVADEFPHVLSRVQSLKELRNL